MIALDGQLFMRYAVADGFTAAAIAGLSPMMDDVIALGASALAPGSDAHLVLDEAVDIADRLSAITSPTLVIGALQDRWVDVSHSHAVASAISGARLQVLPQGHLVIQENAVQVAALLHQHASGA